MRMVCGWRAGAARVLGLLGPQRADNIVPPARILKPRLTHGGWQWRIGVSRPRKPAALRAGWPRGGKHHHRESTAKTQFLADQCLAGQCLHGVGPIKIGENKNGAAIPYNEPLPFGCAR
jgi:hypothetical protein